MVTCTLGMCRLLAGAWTKEPKPGIAQEFFRALAVCHTVIPDGAPPERGLHLSKLEVRLHQLLPDKDLANLDDRELGLCLSLPWPAPRANEPLQPSHAHSFWACISMPLHRAKTPTSSMHDLGCS